MNRRGADSRCLVAGWFSFESMGATAGDLLARDLVAQWLRRAGVHFDLATAPPFTGGIDWREADPGRYRHVLFVCGPFGDGPPVNTMLDRFRNCRWLGLDLSMLAPLATFNPFASLWERDSDRAARPDLTFLAPRAKVSVVGVVRVHRQNEYGDRARHDAVDDAIARLLFRHDCAPVAIDTRLDENAGGLRNAAQVESIIARMDAVVTTRLHGTVLSLKHGVPAVAIDPIAGGAKVARQCATIGWPNCLRADEVDDARLDEALAFALSPAARSAARDCARRARQELKQVRGELIRALRSDGS